jgi:hypothetical protein
MGHFHVTLQRPAREPGSTSMTSSRAEGIGQAAYFGDSVKRAGVSLHQEPRPVGWLL